MGVFSKIFGDKKYSDKALPPLENQEDDGFPPLPQWQPEIKIPEEQIIDRFSYYTSGKADFVVFSHGTCAIIPDGLSDDEAKRAACETLSLIFHYHPDMNPVPMDDGNILVQYNHPAFNVVPHEISGKHLQLIRDNHQKALVQHEVLITPLGPNKFDEFGMQALFGRCYFFMDAKHPVVSKIVRKTNTESQ